jgi:hypothetical protein
MAGRQSILLVESYMCFAVGFDADAHACRLPGVGSVFRGTMHASLLDYVCRLTYRWLLLMDLDAIYLEVTLSQLITPVQHVTLQVYCKTDLALWLRKTHLPWLTTLVTLAV